MKVFISHSTRDRWIARKLSEEIVALGCDTFLDEKDIETGESIDDSIHSHLEDSDDFLLLLSPDSVKSQWVLIELGGALALKKRIVIVLLYLGANEIPKPISKYLARDINDIERYYDEVKKMLSGKKPKVKKKKKRVGHAPGKPSKPFQVDDVVRIISTPQDDTLLVVGWDSGMNKYCGTLAKIEAIDDFDNDSFAKISEDGGAYYWALEWLTHDG